MTENIKVLLAAFGIVSSLVMGFVPHIEDIQQKLAPYQEKLEASAKKPLKLSGWYDILDEKNKITLEKEPVLEFVTSMFRIPHIWSSTNIKEAFSFKEAVPSPRFSSVIVKKRRALNLEMAGRNIDFSGKVMNRKIEEAIQDWREEIKNLPAPIQEKASLVLPYVLLGVVLIGLYSLFIIKKLGKGALIALSSVGVWYILALVSLTLGRHESIAHIPFAYVGIAALLSVVVYRLPIPMYANFFIKIGLILLGVQWAVHQFPAPNEAVEIVLYQGAFGSIFTGIASWILVFGCLALTKQIIKLVKAPS